MRLTRQTQRMDVIYVTTDGDVYVSPDGDGRYWYDTVEQAQEEHGDLPVVRFVTVDPYEV